MVARYFASNLARTQGFLRISAYSKHKVIRNASKATAVQWSNFFLDRRAVRDMIIKAGYDPRAMNRAGAMVRTIARRSIRQRVKRTSISDPGTPPRSHDPRKLFKRIFYKFDTTKKVMVVGMQGMPSMWQFGKETPGLHEHGGSKLVRVPKDILNKRNGSRIRHRYRDSQGRFALDPRRAGYIKARKRGYSEYTKRDGTVVRRYFPKREFVTRRAKYPPRPFMWPAMLKAKNKLPKLWQNLIR